MCHLDCEAITFDLLLKPKQAAIHGVLFGILFGVTGRIWILMNAHAVFDLTAFAIIYVHLETRFAHYFLN
jgi:apolipoprotein N-acyltransferase